MSKMLALVAAVLFGLSAVSFAQSPAPAAADQKPAMEKPMKKEKKERKHKHKKEKKEKKAEKAEKGEKAEAPKAEAPAAPK